MLAGAQRGQGAVIGGGGGDGGGGGALLSTAAAAALRLPALFQPKPRPNSLRDLLKRQARRRKLQEVESQLEESDLRRMAQLLEEQAEAAPGDGELRINYDGFAQVCCFGQLAGAYAWW
jgi:hypothetical protein